MEYAFEAVVVGMGPSGMACAMELADNGVKTAIIDQNQSPGGQVYRQLPNEFEITNTKETNPRKLAGKKLIKRFNQITDQVTVFNGATVWGCFEPNKLNLLQDEQLIDVSFRILIVCEGAKERVIPFPGWTLPQVMTPGGLQKMVCNQGLVPKGRILVSGSGPLLMALGASLVKAGSDLVGICEAASKSELLPLLPELVRQKGLLREGWSYFSALLAKRVKIRSRWGVIAAHGENHVQAATICQLDKNWRPILSTKRTIDVDIIAVGFGFQALSRLTRLLGCKQTYDMASKSFKPKIDAYQRTSLTNVYTAGDAAGVGGALMAEIQGHVAGLHGSLSLGKLTRKNFLDLIDPWLIRRKKMERYVDLLNRFFTPRDGIYEIMKKNTTICRCEGVTAGKIWEYIDEGHQSLVELKSSRLAMGPCQGRVCESIAIEMLRLKGVDVTKIKPLGLRPPLIPLPVKVFEDYAKAEAV